MRKPAQFHVLRARLRIGQPMVIVAGRVRVGLGVVWSASGVQSVQVNIFEVMTAWTVYVQSVPVVELMPKVGAVL